MQFQKQEGRFFLFKGVELFGWLAKIGPAAFVKAAS